MNLENLRPILAPLFGAALCFAVSALPGAAVRDPTLARFLARAVSVDDAKDAGPIEIRIRQWSTDEDVETLRAAIADRRSGKPLPVFRQTRPEAGILLMPGVQVLGGRVLQRKALQFQFARLIETPAGRQVIVATDQHFGFGEPPVPTRVVVQLTDPRQDLDATTAGTPAPDSEFTLLDIRFGPDGNGVGKIASQTKVAYNQAKNILEIENYANEPVRLMEVKSAAR
jgi:hypothetical protein